MKTTFKLLFLFVCLCIVSCSDDESGSSQTDNFDRSAMLENWADHIIIPAFEAFRVKTQNLKVKTSDFNANPSEATLESLRAAYQETYIQFQTVSMFEIGMAETVNFRMRLNTYPTESDVILQKIAANNFNLELPTSFDEQGFPALDFLLNGLAETDAEIIAFYTTDPNAEIYKNYLFALSSTINDLTTEVTYDWTTSFRDTFVNNTSSSSTGAVDRLTNDFVMYYEKYLRSGKIGIPAGAFTGNPVSQNVESYYSAELSKTLYLTALQSVQDFFNGIHFGTTTNGIGFDDYLDYLNTIKNGENLSLLINNNFDATITQAANLNDNLVEQVETNNTEMLQAFDQLQKNVILLKVDMMQALSISVDYVDSDGD
ncbi:MAG TPA: imelysin family protein [Salinimicrobium sp.]|nr:imelysin family protein [Salinimicrobium sp.]